MNSQDLKNKMITSTNMKDVREAANVSLDFFKALNSEESEKYTSQFSFEEKHVQGFDFYFLIFKGECRQMRCFQNDVQIQYETEKVAQSAYDQLKNM